MTHNHNEAENEVKPSQNDIKSMAYQNVNRKCDEINLCFTCT